MSDAELIAEFANNASQEAFSALVEKYTPVVYSAALRILGDPHEAEDAAQATFLVLARKARRLSGGKPLAGWLFRTAELTARNAVRARERRRRHEREGMAMRKDAQKLDATWDELKPELDAAIAALPEKQRDVLVHRYLTGRSEAETAKELGCGKSTVGMRLKRAMEKLRDKLKKRGVMLSAVALTQCLGKKASAAVPSGLSSSIQAACTGQAAASGAAIVMMEGAMKAMVWMKIKVAAAIFCATALVGTAVPVTYNALRAEEPPKKEPLKVETSKPVEAEKEERSKAVKGLKLTLAVEFKSVVPGKMICSDACKQKVDKAMSRPSGYNKCEGCKKGVCVACKYCTSCAKKLGVCEVCGKSKVPELTLFTPKGESEWGAFPWPGVKKSARFKAVFTNTADKKLVLNARDVLGKLTFEVTGPDGKVLKPWKRAGGGLAPPGKSDYPEITPKETFKYPLAFPGPIRGRMGYVIKKPGTYRITVTYANKMVRNPDKKSWIGTVTSNEITIKVLPEGGAKKLVPHIQGPGVLPPGIGMHKTGPQGPSLVKSEAEARKLAREFFDKKVKDGKKYNISSAKNKGLVWVVLFNLPGGAKPKHEPGVYVNKETRKVFLIQRR